MGLGLSRAVGKFLGMLGSGSNLREVKGGQLDPCFPKALKQLSQSLLLRVSLGVFKCLKGQRN